MNPQPKPKRSQNPEYLAWIRQQNCIMCYAPGVVAHHENEKGHGAMGSKCDDERAVPLCHRCHADRHSMGREFWMVIDIERMIKKLYSRYIDYNG